MKQLVIRKKSKQLVVRRKLTDRPIKGHTFIVPKGKYKGVEVLAIKRGFSGWVCKLKGEDIMIFNEEIYETNGDKKKKAA